MYRSDVGLGECFLIVLLFVASSLLSMELIDSAAYKVGFEATRSLEVVVGLPVSLAMTLASWTSMRMLRFKSIDSAMPWSDAINILVFISLVILAVVFAMIEMALLEVQALFARRVVGAIELAICLLALYAITALARAIKRREKDRYLERVRGQNR